MTFDLAAAAFGGQVPQPFPPPPVPRYQHHLLKNCTTHYPADSGPPIPLIDGEAVTFRKHDGYRIITRKEGGRVTLWSRHGTNFTDRLPKVAEAVCSLAADSALIDGEAVTFRSDGHSDFAALRTKAGSARPALSHSIS